MENTVKYENVFDYFETESFKSKLATFFFGRNVDKELGLNPPPRASSVPEGDGIPSQDINAADSVEQTATVNEVTDVPLQDIAVVADVEQTVTITVQEDAVQEDGVQEVISGGKVYKVKKGEDITDLKLDQETLTEAAKKLQEKFSS